MKKYTITALALLLTAAATGFAADNPHMGTWKLNESKSMFAADTGKTTTVKYEAAADDKIKLTLDGVDKDGKPVHGVWMGKMDGKPYAMEGNMPYDMLALKVVDERTNDVTATKDGKPVITGKIEVAKDGKTRVVTTKSTDAAGKTQETKAFYDDE